MNNLKITKSNDLIQASYRLTLQEQRLVMACLAKIDPRADIPKITTLSASEYSELMKVDIKNAGRELYKAADKLFDRHIEIRGAEKVLKFRWIQSQASWVKGEGMVQLEWSTEILKYISQLKSQFTSYKLRHVSGLQSTYSIRLYELLMQWSKTGERVITVADFREYFDLNNKYSTFRSLNQLVISFAVKELNKQSDLVIKYETVKHGRKVHALRFDFKINDQMKMDL